MAWAWPEVIGAALWSSGLICMTGMEF